ncbi:phosphodiester glycosidase family protein [Rhodobacteraceae bacterium]|nr:phosphodiester glycosidase family protein [Paracoccaceae bacterium]
MKTFAAISILSSTLWASPMAAAQCEGVDFEDTPFTVCTTDPATEDIRLFLKDDAGQNLGSFGNLQAQVESTGKALIFAMNAGMYHPDRSPVGLYIQDGDTVSKIVTREGPGNFGLLPNGVLCLASGSAQIIESQSFDADPPNCTYASQSGPMLVIDGTLHPKFLADSTSKFRRNGVGVTADGKLLAVISDRPINFHHFARLFRDVLKTPNALFFDGKVSRLYAPQINRNDLGFPVGPMLGVVE